MEVPEGDLIYRDKGTPQGGLISPLLANLFLHYAFDKWMEVHYESVKFERYADDIIVHCKSKVLSKSLLKEIRNRLESYGLNLHPKKTNLVYCKQERNQKRKVKYDKSTFDFLGFEFKPRSNKLRDGRLCLGFRIGISKGSQKRIAEVIKKLKIHRATGFELEEIANFLAPKLRGWINYFGGFNMSSLSKVMQLLNERLVRWARGKYKRFRKSKEKARAYLIEISEQFPFIGSMVLHQGNGTNNKLINKSRMVGDSHSLSRHSGYGSVSGWRQLPPLYSTFIFFTVI